MSTPRNALERLGGTASRLVRAHSGTALRLAMGPVFLGFGALKFVPGLSPAQDLAVTTTRILTFGLVPDAAALVLVATLECLIGCCLLVGGRLLPVALVLLVPQLVGILSPLVLLPGRLFAGPHHGPTLEGQYVLKDVVLAAAASVLAASLLERRPVPVPVPRVVSAREKLRIVLAGLREECPLGELCDRHGIALSDYERWKDETVQAAAAITAAQAREPRSVPV